MRRIEDLGKNKDYEMLKLMAKGAKSSATVTAAPVAKKRIASKAPAVSENML